VFFLLVIYLFFKNREWKIKFDQKVKEFLEKEEEKIREDAIKRSARTLSGKTLERLVPFLKEFSHDPHDVRWLGDPIDLVIFDGNSQGDLKQITFCEIKSGESELTSIQRKIRELIKNKKVRWEEFRVK
jgi:predicted Holliday junction resolvase-like endonuclease